MQSHLRNIPRLLRRCPEPFVEIHPDSAAGYNIEDSEMVSVETKRVYIEIKAMITGDILPGVVNIPHGWNEANVNILADESPSDPRVSNPSLKAF